MKTTTYPAVTAYTFLQPLRRVMSRESHPAGLHFYDEKLDCVHLLLKQRGHKRKDQPHYLPDQRRCPQCPPDPPPLKGVEVILDDAVPYLPGIGFHYVNDAGRVSLTPTKRVRMHPAYHAQLPAEAFQRRRLSRGLCEAEWVCDECGMKGKNHGGRATHYRVKHQKEV